MKTITGALYLVFALCYGSHVRADIFGMGVNAFDIEFVTIGDPSNPSDTPSPSMDGSVSYSYRIGKFEISRDMIAKANSQGALGISMANLGAFGGNNPNRPATGVSWNEAARFVNWLNTSLGYAPAYKFEFLPEEVGYGPNQNILLWNVADPGYDAMNPFRNRLAKYVLPNSNEIYKAAYYDPVAGVYYDYPTGSNSVPTPITTGTSPGTTVYGQSVLLGPAEVSLAGGLSPYGVMGLGGNVWEWGETLPGFPSYDPAAHRQIFGGSWDGPALGFSASNVGTVSAPTDELLNGGFRVASVIPEPATAILTLFATLALLAQNKRLV